MEEKFQRLLELSEICQHPSRKIGPERFTYALIIAMSDDELTEFYFLNYAGPLENQIVSRIRKRLEEKGPDCLRPLLMGIFEIMKHADFPSYRKYRSHLGRFLPFCSDNFKEIVFNHFISSHRQYDRSLACTAAFDVWNDDIASRLWDAWHLWKDDAILKVLIKKGSPVQLAEILEVAWYQRECSFSTLKELTKLVAFHDFEKVSFLEEENPITYLWLSVISERTVLDKDARRYLKRATDPEEFGFGLYLLGKLKKWKLLNELSYAFYPVDAQFHDLEYDQLLS